jgi:hypothetical protein
MSFNPFLKNESKFNSSYNNKPYRANYSRHDSPSNTNAFSQHVSIKVDCNSFPELNNKKSMEYRFDSPNQTVSESVSNYKKVVTNNLDVDHLTEDKLPHGWIKLNGNRRTIINEKTETMLEKPNTMIAKIADKLNSNSQRYKSQFEEINGEGSYDERYYSSPVFDETDDESVEESSTNDESVDDSTM